jgi:hypothetical protein
MTANDVDFPVNHFRSPAYERRMAEASEKFLAALWREHPAILQRLTANRRRGASKWA